MTKANADVTYAVSGIGWTHTQTVRGRVTKSLITTSRYKWDKEGRIKGRQGMYLSRLIEYAIDGEEPIRIKQGD